MATIEPVRRSHLQKGIRDQDHPCWIETFGQDLCRQQIDDDHQAWTRVTGILMTIVTLGAILAAISVALCMSS